MERDVLWRVGEVVWRKRRNMKRGGEERERESTARAVERRGWKEVGEKGEREKNS